MESEITVDFFTFPPRRFGKLLGKYSFGSKVLVAWNTAVFTKALMESKNTR
jgi:hypothetical protein